MHVTTHIIHHKFKSFGHSQTQKKRQGNYCQDSKNNQCKYRVCFRGQLPKPQSVLHTRVNFKMVKMLQNGSSYFLWLSVHICSSFLLFDLLSFRLHFLSFLLFETKRKPRRNEATFPEVLNLALTMSWAFNDMAIYILFLVKKYLLETFFESITEVFWRFPPREKFFDGAICFANLAGTATIRLIQKLSKLEPSSQYFDRLKFQECVLLFLPSTFPRKIQSRNGQISFHFISAQAVWTLMIQKSLWVHVARGLRTEKHV